MTEHAPTSPSPLASAAPAPSVRYRDGAAAPASRLLPEETPVAIVHDAVTYAVMMATPADLEDLAVGFSLTEGVIASPDEIQSLEIVTTDLGVEARLWLAPGRAADLARRRLIAGPTGCGLCGVESLEQAARIVSRPLAPLSPVRAAEIHQAVTALEAAQALGKDTRAVHAAGLWRPGQGLVAAREDVGRHNAVDKVAGALARSGEAADGVLVLTSRLSVELVQKAAAMGAPVVAAVSAPTLLAIRAAEAAGVTLAGVVRPDAFEVFTHPHRIET
ncbi:MAG: formate dehydrogenase accessory sulfurtransferase FdhD [Proteobacteria bacterium]|nr:formate dehydrogenase accessory sulfurtransferase FdhD [Pseudomonadota bacterium]